MRWLIIMTLLLAVGITSFAAEESIEDRVNKALAAAKAKVLPTPITIICITTPVTPPVVQPIMNPAQRMIINYTHSCPTCGRSQFIVYRFSGAMHSHKCAYDGTEWWH